MCPAAPEREVTVSIVGAAGSAVLNNPLGRTSLEPYPPQYTRREANDIGHELIDGSSSKLAERKPSQSELRL